MVRLVQIGLLGDRGNRNISVKIQGFQGVVATAIERPQLKPIDPPAPRAR